MKPDTRATTSTLSIATTRPMKSPVAVTSRLITGVTVTAGGGPPWAVAASYPVTRMHAANRNRPASGQLLAIASPSNRFTFNPICQSADTLYLLHLLRRRQFGIERYLCIKHLGNWT